MAEFKFDDVDIPLKEEIIKYRIQNSNNPIEEFFKYTLNFSDKILQKKILCVECGNYAIPH